MKFEMENHHFQSKMQPGSYFPCVPYVWHTLCASLGCGVLSAAPRLQKGRSKGHPCPNHPHGDPLTLSRCLTYFGQGRQHDPESDFKGDLNMLIIQREKRVFRGLVALGFLTNPADVLQDHVLQQRHGWGALGDPDPAGLDDRRQQGPS